MNKILVGIILISFLWISGAAAIEIVGLQDKDYVEVVDQINISVNETIGKEDNVYAMVWYVEGSGPWRAYKAQSEGGLNWTARAVFGEDDEWYPDTDWKIVAIIANSDLEGGQFWTLPIYSAKSEQITVIRR